MALVGYVRVSSLDQDTSTKHRTALVECLDYLREGDTLVITKIDRLARSARDLHNLIHALEQRHISLLVLDQRINTSTPHGRFFLGMLATFAEFETNIRKERQFEGIAAAKAKGKYTGRKPTAQNKAAETLSLVDQGLTKVAIAEHVGISVASVYNVINKAKQVL